MRPEELGLPVDGRRRVPGLRREEPARLAGVSADYPVRLEQGRDIHPSEAVLGALAGALGLDADEREHLRALAGAARRGRSDCRRRLPPQRVRAGALLVLDGLRDSPSLVVGRWLEVLAQNELAVALVGDLRGGNLLRFLFLDEASRALLPDWERVAERAAGFLRARGTSDRADLGLCELAGELLLGSPEFGRLWEAHHVRGRWGGSTRVAHPLVGEVELDCEVPALSDPDQRLVTGVVAEGSPARAALDLLATSGLLAR